MTKSEKAKDKRLRLLFRTTLEEYKKIEDYQKKTKFKVLLGKRNGLDHHHASGQVRGLLDWRLNKALGVIEGVAGTQGDAIYLLEILAEYLRNNPAVNAVGFRYGLIGQAKRKRKMVYGPPND